jgi:hypothetical protein
MESDGVTFHVSRTESRLALVLRALLTLVLIAALTVGARDVLVASSRTIESR